MSYCTLQEAFNEISFDSPAKKKKSCQMQAKASADPYDPYFPENGRGEKSAWDRFVGRPNPSVEGFQNASSGSSSDNIADKFKYRGRGSDYKYYCDNFGVCATDPQGGSVKKIERFQNKNDAVETPKCNIQSPQKYEVPVSDEAKEMYDRAFDTAMMQENRNGATFKPEPRKDDMDQVSGFYDEDLEQYLKTKDLSAAPKIPVTPITPRELKAEPYDPRASPFVKAMELFEKKDTETQETSGNKEKTAAVSVVSSPNQYIWDLLLFIFAGVLIILLCEQLFKLAIMIGMRKAIMILEPVLSQIKV